MSSDHSVCPKRSMESAGRDKRGDRNCLISHSICARNSARSRSSRVKINSGPPAPAHPRPFTRPTSKRHHARIKSCGCRASFMSFSFAGRLLLAAAIVIFVSGLQPALAGVVVQIDKSSQRMAVSVDGASRYSWPVSTGRGGYGTPSGVFHPQIDGADALLAQILQLADAAFDLLLLRLCHSRHQRYPPARRSAPRMAASGCILRMRRRCTRWSSATARAIRGSRSTSAGWAKAHLRQCRRFYRVT